MYIKRQKWQDVLLSINNVQNFIHGANVINACKGIFYMMEDVISSILHYGNQTV